MTDENCKAIEKHIKDLLFNKTSPLSENSQNAVELLEKMSADANTYPDRNQTLNTGNYHAFNTAVSPPRGYKVNPAFRNQSPVLYQGEMRGIGICKSSSCELGRYQNARNAFSPQNYSQSPSSNSYVGHQMHDVTFLNVQQNSGQITGASQNSANSSSPKSSLNSHLQREAVLDKAPGVSEKLHGRKTYQDVVLLLPKQATDKDELQKDLKNKKRKKKDKRRKPKNSPDGDVPSENINSILDPFTDLPDVNNKPLSREKFTPFQQKGDSLVAPLGKGNEFVKRVSKPVFSEDGETVILRNEGLLYFFCYICDCGCSELNGMIRHIAAANHKTQLKASEMRHLLLHLPRPLPKQVESVTNCIVHVANTYGLTDDDLNLRKRVVDRVKEKIESHISGCHLEPIGSSITGFGLKVSHVDIVLKVPKEKNAADMLFTTFELLKEDKSFKEVHNEFRKKIPQIEFVDVESGLTCNICIDNGTVSEFTKLLCDYAELDPRVRVLGNAFRYWAKMCEIDQQDQGTLPPFCYILMLIYFLQQQTPPVLPVIPMETDWCSKNTASIGDLWIKLFRYYSLEYHCGEDVVCIRKPEKVSCEDKNWGTKLLAIEDPIVQRNLAHVIPNRQVYQFMHDCFIRTYNYFGRPQFCSGPAELTSVPQSNKDESVSDAVGFKNVSTIVHKTDVEEKQGFPEETPPPDDILNVSDLVEDQDPEIPFDDVISIVNNLTIDEIVSEEEFERDSSDSLGNTFENCRTHNMSPSLFANFPSLTIIAHDQVPPFSKICLDDAEEKPLGRDGFPDISAVNGSGTYSWNVDVENSMEEIHYEFSQDNFRGDKSVPLVCNLCQKQGHQKKDCPDEILPTLAPLPPMTSDYITTLDLVCEQIMEENQPSQKELRMRDQDLQELEDYIQQIFPDAELQMFGSFCNGFGFTRSDMDICLTFKENLTGKDLDCIAIIEQLATRLCQNPKLTTVVPITSAKVPIVKFVFRESGLEGDISLYNTLAQHNTRMLDLYCKIDQRVRVLGYTLKYFAKILNIGDASRGSLSSYAYILMVLFFLQQREPPVIPVLQELHNGKQPIFMVDEWNAWFYNDLKNLRNVWPECGKNTESVGELWLGLLRFYTEEFDSNEHVVCIRQKKFLTRFRKLWNSKSIAIEDPFDLSHNLGSGLSRRMNNYILKAFIRGRNHFGTSVGKLPSGVSAKDFLFYRRILCDGQEPPNDRGCRFCGKIGHIMKDCPKKTQRNQDQGKTDGPKNQNANNPKEPVYVHRPNFQERRGYQRREYEKRSRQHGNRSPRNNNTQHPVAKSNFERSSDVPPGNISHLLSLQRFPGPVSVSNSFNPPPFTSKIPPPSFVHRPATSTPFPIMNSALVTSLSPHKNSLTQHTAAYLSQPQNYPTSNNSAQGENNHCLTTPQKNAFLPSERSLPLGSSYSNSGQIVSHPIGKQHQFRGHPRDDVYGPHNPSGRW